MVVNVQTIVTALREDIVPRKRAPQETAQATQDVQEMYNAPKIPHVLKAETALMEESVQRMPGVPVERIAQQAIIAPEVKDAQGAGVVQLVITAQQVITVHMAPDAQMDQSAQEVDTLIYLKAARLDQAAREAQLVLHQLIKTLKTQHYGIFTGC